MSVTGVNGITPQLYNTDNAQKVDNGTVKFEEIFANITGGKMAQEITDNFNVTLDVSSISETFYNKNNSCLNYVKISPETLSKMEHNPALKKKVMRAIEEFCSIEEQNKVKALQPPVKSQGMIVYPDGSTLYWLEGYSYDLEDNKNEYCRIKESSLADLIQKYGTNNSETSILPTNISVMAALFKNRKEI